MNKDFFGVHWMLVTPFDKGEGVDTASIPPLVGKAREAGCSGVVALGVTGEAERLTDQERALVAESVIQAANGLPITLGTTAASTQAATARSLEAQRAKANLDALFLHYQRIAGAVDLPIVV